jgi:hypothetical protein
VHCSAHHTAPKARVAVAASGRASARHLLLRLPSAPHSSSVAQTFSLCIVRTPHATREGDFGSLTLGFLRVGLSFACVGASPFLNIKLPGAPHSSSVAQTFSLCIVRTPHATREDDFGSLTLGFLRVGLSFASVSASPFLKVARGLSRGFSHRLAGVRPRRS